MGPERELTADQFQLICLGILQLFSGIAEIGAGVGQGRSQPGAIEVDGKIVVVGDRGAVPLQRVLSPTPEPLGQVGRRAPETAQDVVAGAAGMLVQMTNRGERREQIAFDIQILVNEGFSQGAVGRVFQKRMPGRRGLDHKRALWLLVLR